MKNKSEEDGHKQPAGNTKARSRKRSRSSEGGEQGRRRFKEGVRCR
jgi:hypothetical protein